MSSSKHGNDSSGPAANDPQYAEGYRGEKKLDTHPTAGEEQGEVSASGSRSANDPNRKGADADSHEDRIANPGLERDGGHRLFENRTQHDDAEKDSERNRVDRDVNRHGHDAGEFQGHDAEGTEPAGGADHRANIRNVGQGGGNRADKDRTSGSGGHHGGA